MKPGVYHVIPVADVIEHCCSSDCWCRPHQDLEGGFLNIWVHNSMDRREVYEGLPDQ